MKMKELMQAIGTLAPVSYAMDWDNVGLLVGDPEKEVRKIYLALDMTTQVMERAAAAGCDTILTHHPMLFSPVKRITADDFMGRRIMGLISHGINYYAMHTNYDVAVMGRLCSDRLGLTYEAPLEITGEAEGRPIGIGSIGSPKSPVTLGALAALVRVRFELPAIRVFGDPEAVITRAAMCPGSGKGMDREALAGGAQVLITGDVDHHYGLDSLEKGLMMIDAGHHGLEHVYVDHMAGWLGEHFPELAVIGDENRSPFSVI